MAAFENANFEDHPSTSSEYVKFLAMNSGFEALEAIAGKLKSMQDQIKDFQSSVKQADKKAENAVSYCETNKKAVGALEKRMSTQESKK
jgi:DNA repair ATPase RecN